jgi:fibro-slime domain-containing protein/LPXTG-motif cell wall-anchored protein
MNNLWKKSVAFLLCMALIFGCTFSTNAADDTGREESVEEIPAAVSEEVPEEETVLEEETVPEEETEEEAQETKEEAEKETEEEEREYVQILEYEDDEIRVFAGAEEEGVIPEGTSLSVIPILEDKDETKDQYKDVEAKLQEKIQENIAEDEEEELVAFLAYDISFVDQDGNKVEPDGAVTVTMDYKEAAIPEKVKELAADSTSVSVMHLEEDENGQVTNVVDMQAEDKVNVLDITEKQEIQRTEFVTESFSTFTISWGTRTKTLTVSYVDTSGSTLSYTGTDQTITLTQTNNTTARYALSAYAPESLTLAGDSYTLTGAQIQINNGSWYDVEYIQYTGTYVQFYRLNQTTNNEEIYTFGDSRTFKLRYVYTKQVTPLPTVETVDSKAAGITIKMIDYSTSAFSGAGWYTNSRGVKQGVLSKTVDGNGYPAFTNNYSITINSSSAKSFQDLFTGTTEANHLFLKSTYDETGYYYYNSRENGASYDASTGDFTVYDALTTPENSNSDIFTVGNFLPYNTFLQRKESSYKTSDGKTLYLPDQSSNYYFGLEMSANFYQAENGIQNGNAMVYEFNGDDDLWVYIDGTLVLDLGGCHDARSGYIDFSTGEVYVEGIGTTTLYQLYVDAGTADSIAWKEITLSNGKTAKIFADYTQHSFQMWYMERGAAASNLQIRFNLPVIPDGTLEVKKELTNTDKQLYANVEFGFQVYAQAITSTDSDGNESYSDEYVLLKDAVLSGTDTPIIFEDDGTFYLKADQAAMFSGLQKNRKYYVKEVSVKSQEYDKVVINGTETIYFAEDGTQTGAADSSAQSSISTAKDRPFITFKNNCSVANSRELQITKAMKDGQTTEDTFSFMVLLEAQDGELAPYASGDYYLKDAKGNYYTYADNTLQSNGTTAVICAQTGKDGMISGVPAGYTVVITQILSGTNFKVEEVNLNSDKYKTPVITVQNCKTDGLEENVTGQIQLSKDAMVTVTNELKVVQEWKLVKVSKNNTSLYLKSAEFELSDGTNTIKGISSEDGQVVWEKTIPAGTYTLRETKAPTGYVLSDETWKLTFTEAGGVPVVTKGSDNTAVTGTTETTTENGTTTEITTYYFVNDVVYDLPSAGSSGIYWYMISGTAIMMASALILYRSRRKKVKNKA